LNAIPPIHDESDEESEEHPVIKPKVPSEDTTSTSSSSSYTRFSELTRKEWATIGLLSMKNSDFLNSGMLAIANLCSTIAFSCLAPFFPAEAQLKNLNSSEVGIVFGIFEMTMFILSPILGKYMAAIGSKRMFIAGLLITGVSTIMFGFLNFLPSGRIFFWTAILIRCAEAFGDACFVTSSFAISVATFPGRISTVVGIMETFAGLGFTLGPFIGYVLDINFINRYLVEYYTITEVFNCRSYFSEFY
jgi:MFS family permease